MATVRAFADLQTLRSPSVAPVTADAIEIGHVVSHGEAQASAFDAAGKPLGTFSSQADAESAVSRASFQGGEH